MEKKSLFSIRLSATNSSHEFWIPAALTIQEATELVCALLVEQKGRFFAPNATSALYLSETGEELDVNLRIGECGFAHGTQLVLI